MPDNQGGIDAETLMPIALIAGAGLLIWTVSKKGGTMPPTPTGYCVPQEIVTRLMSIPGLTSVDPTAMCRYYAATPSQQAYFWTLSDSLKVALMQMSPEEALWFTCWSCAFS